MQRILACVVTVTSLTCGGALTVAQPVPALQPFVPVAVPLQPSAPLALQPSVPVAVPLQPSVPLAVQPLAPVAGDLFSRVRSKLGDERSSLGGITEALLDVTSTVDQTERDVLGKVINAEDARGLAASHAVMDASNVQAREQLTQLNAQIDALSAEVAVAQRTFTAEGHRQEDEVKSLRNMLAQQQSLLKRTVFLATEHKNVEAKHADVVKKDINIKQQLEEAQRQLQQEDAEQERLRKALLDVHQYGVTCHERTLQFQKEVRILDRKPTSHSAAEEAAQRQASSAAAATLQRYKAEGALLRAEITDKERMAKTGLSALKGHQHELTLLENHIITEVKNISSRMNNTKTRTSLLEIAVEENINKADEDMGRRGGLETELDSLKKRLNPIIFAALRSENNALQQEVTGATFLLQSSKEAEAKAFATSVQKHEAVKAQQEAVKITAQQQADARQDQEEQFQSAVKESEENKAKADTQTMTAKAVIAARCQPKWEGINTTKTEELETCHKMEEELTVVDAQKEILKQTMKAQQTADAVSSDTEIPEEKIDFGFG